MCCCWICLQGNFCIYKISDDNAPAPTGNPNKPTSKDQSAAEETQAEDEKEDENKTNKKLKLSVGLPSNYPIEVKVMVYIIRVRSRYVCALFSGIVIR